MKKTFKELVQKEYESLYKKVREIEDPELLKIREEALETFLNIENIDREVWKYTPIDPLFQMEIHPVPAPSQAVQVEPPLNTGAAVKVQFTNGRPLSSPTSEGFQIHPLREAVTRDDLAPHVQKNRRALLKNWNGNPFILLNLALAEEGLLFIAPAEGEMPKIELLYTADTQKFGGLPWWNIQNIAVFPANSQGEIIEISAGKGSYLSNVTLSAQLDRNSRAKLMRLQLESEESFGLYNQLLTLNSSARANLYSFGFGGKLNRGEIRAQLLEEGADCQIDGFYLAGSSQAIEHFINIEHLSPHCESSQFFRAVLADKGKGIFTGKIYVAPDAQKTNAYQKHDAILLSHYSQVYARPQLEIFADDVRCSHGATSGRIDAEALFYLRARGIPEFQAKRLLTTAFANTALQKLNEPQLQEQIEKIFLEKLEPYL